MNQQSQFNRVNGFGNGNGILQHNGGKMGKNTRQQVARQTQPLSVSQLANIQQGQDVDYRGLNGLGKTRVLTSEAQYARAKLSSKKSFNLEDDLEFYPNQIETKKPTNTLNSRMIMNSNSPISPYNTPTKTVQFGNQQQVHRMNGYMSPAQVMQSPQQQQQRVLSHNQIFTSPQNLSNIRRLDLSNASPMYHHQNSPNRW